MRTADPLPYEVLANMSEDAGVPIVYTATKATLTVKGCIYTSPLPIPQQRQAADAAHAAVVPVQRVGGRS